jgi:ADP-heptose:LPS heptosyltransferase
MFDVKLMRRVDSQVGNLVCSLLAGAKRLGLPGRRGSETPIRKVAVAKFFGLGSLVVAAPAVAALRDIYPGAEIHFVTFQSNKEVLEILGIADRAWFIDNSSAKAFAQTTLVAARALRKEGIDLLIDFEFFAKFPLVFGSLANIRRFAGFCLTPERWRMSLLDVPGTYNHYFHTKDIFLSLIYLMKTKDMYYLDFETFRQRYEYPTVTVDPADREHVRALLAERGVGGRSIIVLNPNTSPDLAPEVRKWPEERYAELATAILREDPNACIAVIGAKSEREYVGRIVSRIGSARATSLAGDLSLRRLLALFAIADLVVTNDSGPMHLACLVDAPVLGLFFADTPTLFAPLSPGARVVAPRLYSMPIFSVYNGKDVIAGKPVDSVENRVARSVPVEQVHREVRAMLKERSASNARRASSMS